jgi:hypothetical protein
MLASKRRARQRKIGRIACAGLFEDCSMKPGTFRKTYALSVIERCPPKVLVFEMRLSNATLKFRKTSFISKPIALQAFAFTAKT